MSTTHRVDPRIRAYGKARIDVTRRAQNEAEWQAAWREPRFPFPFQFGKDWKMCVQYLVEDFAAEVGFFIDVLGFPVGAFSPNYAQFTSPGSEFTFGVATLEGNPGTPPESISLQFMLNDLPGTIQELERRGVEFEYKPVAVGMSPAIAVLRTPHGVRLELWGMAQPQPAEQPAERPPLSTDSADFWTDYPEETPEPEQPQETSGEDLENTEEGEGLEDEHLEEPVYVDEEAEVPSEALVAAPRTTPPQTGPSFPAKIIRRVEDIGKLVSTPTGHKIKGNGMRGFPTLNDRLDGSDA